MLKKGLFFKNKKADNILVENIIFLVLNVLFFAILIIFLARQGQGVVLNEEIFAKKIALIIDNAKPDSDIIIDFSKAVEIAQKKNFDISKIVTITDNIIKVQLSEKSGYSYSFFNSVEANAFLLDINNPNKLIIVVREKEANKENGFDENQ